MGKNNSFLLVDEKKWIVLKENRTDYHHSDTLQLRDLPIYSLNNARDLIYPLQFDFPINVTDERNKYLVSLINVFHQSKKQLVPQLKVRRIITCNCLSL